jgi:hypothetical protein
MTVDGAVSVFAIGSAGGVLAELLHWWNLREATQLPAYVKSPLYWIITLVMVGAGGFIAWLYFGAHADGVVALHVGLATPLILQKLVTSVPQERGAKSIVVAPAPSVRNFFTW